MNKLLCAFVIFGAVLSNGNASSLDNYYKTSETNLFSCETMEPLTRSEQKILSVFSECFGTVFHHLFHKFWEKDTNSERLKESLPDPIVVPSTFVTYSSIFKNPSEIDSDTLTNRQLLGQG